MKSGELLSGVRILDLSEQVPGPYATRLLSGLGASVTKVERLDGDRLRARPAMFGAENRGKRGLAIDLKQPAGHSALLRLVEQSEVLVEGFRPGIMDRLELSFAQLSAVNPKLIYASISGYGTTGPYRNLPGHDFQYLAYAGAIPAPPAESAATYVPTTLPVADMGTSVFTILAIVLALLEKQRDPVAFAARHLDIAMSDCTLAMMEPRLAEALTEATTAAALARPGYGIYATADARYVSIGALEDHFWARLTTALELPELAEPQFADFQQRRRNVHRVETLLRARVAQLNRDELIDRLIRHDVPVAPVNDLHEAASDPHAAARGMVYDRPGEPNPRVAEWPVALDTFASRASLTPAPAVGADSREVLADHGFSPSEIDALIDAGVVGGPVEQKSS